MRDKLIRFMDSLRNYVAESGADIAHDERDSSGFVNTFLVKEQSIPRNSISDSFLPKCTRVEVIDRSGRAYTNYDCESVETQMQDEGRTLKVFIS